ncbi:MAG: isocitrate lyase/PEP mutase family protein [Pseudomonadota bacterium]
MPASHTRDLRARLRALVASGRTVAVPGATDALSAKLIERHGFDAVYIGSYATAASRYALPDTGLLSLDDLAAQARTIANAVDLPVIADAEGGFNDPANMWRTVQAFEQAGAAAIHIEDHMGAGKHTDLPQSLRPLEEAAARIRAAVEAREDPDFLIAARSDASWIGLGFCETLKRLQAYADAGADLVFPTLVTAEQVAEIRRRIGKPVMIVDLPNGTLADEERAGASLVLYYSFAALVQYEALGRALERFKSTRDANAVPGYRSSVRAFEDFMGYREQGKSGSDPD